MMTLRYRTTTDPNEAFDERLIEQGYEIVLPGGGVDSRHIEGVR